MKSPLIVQSMLGLAGVLAALVLWELLTKGPLAETPVPAFSATLRSLGTLLVTASFWSTVLDTILMAFIGLVVSVASGILLGLLIATSPALRAALRVPLEFLKPIPPIVVSTLR